MVISMNTAKWRELFEAYKKMTVLWQFNSANYNNKLMRDRAWIALLRKFREIEPGASLEKLKKRITNIRTCYRRELRKVQTYGKDGYTPGLWYFDMLDFLKDHEKPQHRRKNFKVSEKESDVSVSRKRISVRQDLKIKASRAKQEIGDLKITETAAPITDSAPALTLPNLVAALTPASVPSLTPSSVTPLTPASPPPLTPASAPPTTPASAPPTSLPSLTPAPNSLHSLTTAPERVPISFLSFAETGALGVRDEAAIHADSWACTFRRLSAEQQIYAKRAMDEILTLGQLEKLTYNTVGSVPATAPSHGTFSTIWLPQTSPPPSQTEFKIPQPIVIP